LNGPDPTIRLGIALSPESYQVINQFGNAITARVRDLKQTRGDADPELKKLKEIQQVLRMQGDQHEKNTNAVRRYSSELQQAGRILGSAVSGVAGGAGVASPATGAAAGLLGAGSVAAGIGIVVSAVAVIVGQAARMAYEFERVSTRASATLTIGSGNFARNLAAVKQAAYAGENYGIGAPEMSGVIAAYGLSSGATALQTAGASTTLARYARGYGIDPTQLAGIAGGLTAQNGEGADSALNSVFGGASGAGNLGRRITEFIGAAMSVMTTLQTANPGANVSWQTSASLARNIAATGGIFNTAQGVQMGIGASASLMSGTSSDVRKMAFAMRAGITNPVDLILERNSPENMRKQLLEAVKESGGTGQGIRTNLAATLAGLVGPQQASTLYALLGGDHIANAAGANQAINRLYNTKSAGSSNVDDAVKNYQDTMLSKFEILMAQAANKMVQAGDNIDQFAGGLIGGMEKSVAEFGAAVDRFDKATGGHQQGINALGIATVAATPFLGLGAPMAAAWFINQFGKKGAGSVSGVGPYASDVMTDYNNQWTGDQSHGITPALRSEMDLLKAQGFNMGVYDFTEAHGTLPKTNSHRQGRAADIDSINGHMIGNTATPDVIALAVAALKSNATVGAFPDLLKKLEAMGYQEGNGPGQVFADSDAHVHVQVANGTMQLRTPSGQIVTTTVTPAPQPAVAGPRGGNTRTASATANLRGSQ
jgi:hypothetical protein